MNSTIRMLVMAPFVGLAGYFFVQVTRVWAARHLLDVPNERSLHHRPTPRGGGMAIVIGTFVGWMLYLLLTPGARPDGLRYLVTAGGLVAAVSLVDDLKSLSPWLRITVHGLAALIAVAGFGYWTAMALPAAGTLSLSWIGLPLTVLWVVGMTNAYNFMDGIDGLAGAQAVVSGVGWALVAVLEGSLAAGALSLFAAVTSLAFLSQNWSPARIFMGDIGSAFLGFLFAALPLLVAQSAVRPDRLPLTGILMVWPFVFDSSFTLADRLRKGENVLQAHRSHLYQRLVRSGLPHSSVTLLYALFSAFSCVLALAWQFYPEVTPWAPSGALVLGGALFLLVRFRNRQGS